MWRKRLEKNMTAWVKQRLRLRDKLHVVRVRLRHGRRQAAYVALKRVFLNALRTRSGTKTGSSPPNR